MTCDGPLGEKRPDAVDASGSTFAYVGLQDKGAVPAYLEAIAESLRAGRLVLAAGEEEFSSSPADLVRLRVEAGRTEDIVHVTVRLSWSEETPAAKASAVLSIGSE